MKMVDLNNKTKDELLKLRFDFSKELMNLRFQKVGGELKNTSRFKLVRKSIARINYLLNKGSANA